jgi:hypothetical protein
MGRVRAVYFIFRAPNVVALSVSIKDRSFGPSEHVRLCTDAYEIYVVQQT